LPVLELVIAQFPFVITGFPSGNGSEYINGAVANIFSTRRIEQTKPRSRQREGNALTESKNAGLVRKHIGYAHTPKQYAKLIDAAYQDTVNPWLNSPRPCLFATEVINARGKIIKRQKHKVVKNPLEILARLRENGLVTLNRCATLAVLTAQATSQTDLVGPPWQCNTPRQNYLHDLQTPNAAHDFQANCTTAALRLPAGRIAAQFAARSPAGANLKADINISLAPRSKIKRVVPFSTYSETT